VFLGLGRTRRSQRRQPVPLGVDLLGQSGASLPECEQVEILGLVVALVLGFVLLAGVQDGLPPTRPRGLVSRGVDCRDAFG
jgi:hypothetical protein